VAHVNLAFDLEDRPVGREQRRLVEGAVALVEADLSATYFSMSFWLERRSYS